jgi:translation initiation factor IF-3
MAHPELGLRILERIADEVSDIAIVEAAPRQDGRNMTMVLHPTAKSGGASSSSGARKRRPSGDGAGSNGPPAAVSEPASGTAPETAPAPAPEPVATEPAS